MRISTLRRGLARSLILCLHVIALSMMCPALPASVSASEWIAADYVEGRLISATQGTGNTTDLLVAIDLKLKPKWKTYWRSPGDAGLPPETDWQRSENLEQETLLFPAPVRFQLFGLQTFGYENRVVFPVRMKLKAAGKKADLKLKITVLMCSDVCVPQSLNLVLLVPAGEARPSEHAHLIQRAIAAVPSDGPSSGLRVKHVTGSSNGSAGGIQVEVVSDHRLGDLDVIPEVTPFIAFSAPVFTRSVDQKSARALFKLAQPLPAGESLAGRKISVTVTNGGVASQTDATIDGDGGTQIGSSLATLTLMLGAALLGGLILNLMPCVLPVLSIKLLSLVEAKSHTARKVRTNFLATAAGIISALLALAAILVTVKSAGVAVGWGIQFQQPLFIASMAVIITLFACNLWGFFEISLPSALSNWAASKGSDDTSQLNHFLTGIFVTILATPCSAPFVGTAVGFALASGAVQTLAIFTALGLGLALPYIAVAVNPSWVRFLPRPGQWMVRLRQVLGFALLATAIWLMTVLANQVGWPLTGLSALGLVAVIGVLRLYHLKSLRLAGPVVAGLIAVLGGVSIVLPNILSSTQSVVLIKDNGPISWQTFDERKIRGLIAQGQTVFVDVTADWCITCKANKRLVLHQDTLVKRLNEGIVAMQADWTSPDPKITSFLARFGRYGIPMNVVFGPGSPQGILLPELLTSERVLEALNSASDHSEKKPG